MKDRKRPRENRSRKYDKPWLNSEGYRDPTAYQALKNIERSTGKGKTSR